MSAMAIVTMKIIIVDVLGIEGIAVPIQQVRRNPNFSIAHVANAWIRRKAKVAPAFAYFHPIKVMGIVMTAITTVLAIMTVVIAAANRKVASISSVVNAHA